MLSHRLLIYFLILLACPACIFTLQIGYGGSGYNEVWPRQVKLSLNDFISSCCFQGSQHGKLARAATCKIQRDYSKGRKLEGHFPVMSIPPSDNPNKTQICLQTFETCCRNDLYDTACTEGYNMALKRKDCLNYRKFGSYGTAYAEKMLDCCSACNAGIETAKKTKRCQKNTIISDDYDSMFEKCCSDQLTLIAITASKVDLYTTTTPRTPYQVVAGPGVSQVSSGKEDRCLSLNHNRCHHLCHDPGYGLPLRCSCRDGFRLINRYECEDIDECSDGIIRCSTTEVCANTPGSYKCVPIVISPNVSQVMGRNGVESSSGLPYSVPLDSATGRCPSGYKVKPSNPNYCIDIDECTESSNPETLCDHRFSCQNTWGKFVCTPIFSSRRTFDKCAPGLKMEGEICLDINECAIGNHNCKLETEKCVNTHGSFKCDPLTARADYESSNAVTNLLPNCPEGEIYNIFERSCIKEQYFCREGYLWDPETRKCEDVDECEMENACDEGSICKNIVGSFRCDQIICLPGQVLNGRRCISNPCHTHQVWNPNSQSCEESDHRIVTRPFCPSGYKQNNLGTCEDIDECALNLHSCRADQNCFNLEGHYRCSCKTGFTPSMTNDSCVDIDECLTGSVLYCSIKEDCINTHGSFECRCKPGLSKSVLGICEDIDECSLGNHNCDQICINNIGSFTCGCRSGFAVDLSNSSKCVDVNECIEQPNSPYFRRSSHEKPTTCQFECENTYGSFRCKCPTGYLLDPDTNRTCLDVDECDGDACPEEENGICLNTRGGFKCIQVDCPPGYEHESTLRCRRILTELCSVDDAAGCVETPVHYTFNYFTFPSNLKLTSDGKMRIFEISGVQNFTDAYMRYDFDLMNVLAESPKVIRVQKSWFDAQNDGKRMIFSSRRQIEGPQSFEIHVKAQIYYKGNLAATNIVKSFIYVSEYDF